MRKSKRKPKEDDYSFASPPKELTGRLIRDPFRNPKESKPKPVRVMYCPAHGVYFADDSRDHDKAHCKPHYLQVDEVLYYLAESKKQMRFISGLRRFIDSGGRVPDDIIVLP